MVSAVTVRFASGTVQLAGALRDSLDLLQEATRAARVANPSVALRGDPKTSPLGVVPVNRFSRINMLATAIALSLVATGAQAAGKVDLHKRNIEALRREISGLR